MGCKCTKEEEETGEYLASQEDQITKAKTNIQNIPNANSNNHESQTNQSNDYHQTNDKEDIPPMLNYDMSILRKKKKKPKAKNVVYYDDEILRLFNLARNKPLNYCKHIDYCITLITANHEGQIVVGKEDTNKIGLRDGISKFNECKRFLIQSEPCKTLEYDEDLALEISDDPNLWLDHDYIKQIIIDKQNELMNLSKKNYQIFGFHFDYGMSDPVISSVLQLVDDNNCENRRRFNILNPDYRSVGVSYKNQGKKFVSYFFFAG